jgi:dimethylargininase
MERQPIDPARASAQHAEYERTLERLGCEVRRLPESADLPDSVFVEDTAVVLDEIAIIARPGAASRQAEIPEMTAALSLHRPMAQITAPGTVEGGDILVIDRRVYVGLSSRTNACGLRQIVDILRPFGYEVTPVPIARCLHLKSAATRVAKDAVLINREWIDVDAFPKDLRLIDVDPLEPFGANALLIGERVIHPAVYTRTADRLARAGIRVATVDVSEILKAEGGVTCCSLVFEG